MALEIIKSERHLRKFLTYDMEWIPGTMQIRVVGVYDGHVYRHYQSVRQFLAYELSSRNRGKWFYAHAGGLADVQFVLDELVHDPAYSIKASFSGSSAIIVHVTRGKNSWHFVDSYWLLRDSLANIGRAIGQEKTGPFSKEEVESEEEQTQERIKEWYRSAPRETLIPYNENDCVILWNAINEFETALLDLGGQLMMTLASCAMNLFRRRYLTRSVATWESINNIAREAYHASRVEVFNRFTPDTGYYFDINSSFPYAMTKPVPGELIGTTWRLPDTDNPYLSDVTVEVPDMYAPPLPFRRKGKVFFPTGTWRAWLSNIDIALLYKAGGRVTHCYESKVFEPFYDLGQYAIDIYKRRVAAQSDMEKMVLKLLLNSLYGKFAENNMKDVLRINPTAGMLIDMKKRMRSDDPLSPQMLFPGAWLDPQLVDVPHMHVPISVHITAQARATLYDYLMQADSFNYCDTDGFSTETMFPTSSELGALKLEKEVQRGVFIAPKVYRLDMRDGKTIVRAKGFSLGKMDPVKGATQEAIGKFEDLLENKDIEVERMVRIRENYRSQITTPNERRFKKGLRTGKSLPKRYPYPDGATRPWTVNELETILPLKTA